MFLCPTPEFADVASVDCRFLSSRLHRAYPSLFPVFYDLGPFPVTLVWGCGRVRQQAVTPIESTQEHQVRRDADPGIPILEQAKSEYSKLQ
jgi:hypothetical protein